MAVGESARQGSWVSGICRFGVLAEGDLAMFLQHALRSVAVRPNALTTQHNCAQHSWRDKAPDPPLQKRVVIGISSIATPALTVASSICFPTVWYVASNVARTCPASHRASCRAVAGSRSQPPHRRCWKKPRRLATPVSGSLRARPGTSPSSAEDDVTASAGHI